jgi:MFS family permease
MCVFLAALDTVSRLSTQTCIFTNLFQTIISTALPTIAEDFHSSAGYAWIGSAYLLGAAASTPIWAKFSDIFGRKPILMVANVVFFVGCLVCARSNSIGMLIAGRAVQGMGGGGLITLVSVSIGDLFSMRYVFCLGLDFPHGSRARLTKDSRTRGLYYGLVGFVWASKLHPGVHHF